jgi:hypothetical protein
MEDPVALWSGILCYTPGHTPRSKRHNAVGRSMAETFWHRRRRNNGTTTSWLLTPETFSWLVVHRPGAPVVCDTFVQISAAIVLAL